jgi:hypothetical protein
LLLIFSDSTLYSKTVHKFFVSLSLSPTISQSLYYLYKSKDWKFSQGLRSLNLHWCSNLTDSSLKMLTILTNLTELDLSSCRAITNGIISFLSELPNLKIVNLQNCLNITKRTTLPNQHHHWTMIVWISINMTVSREADPLFLLVYSFRYFRWCSKCQNSSVHCSVRSKNHLPNLLSCPLLNLIRIESKKTLSKQ